MGSFIMLAGAVKAGTPWFSNRQRQAWSNDF